MAEKTETFVASLPHLQGRKESQMKTFEYGYYRGMDGRRFVLGKVSDDGYEEAKKEIDYANKKSREPGLKGSTAGMNDRWFIEEKLDE